MGSASTLYPHCLGTAGTMYQVNLVHCTRLPGTKWGLCVLISRTVYQENKHFEVAVSMSACHPTVQWSPVMSKQPVFKKQFTGCI